MPDTSLSTVAESDVTHIGANPPAGESGETGGADRSIADLERELSDALAGEARLTRRLDDQRAHSAALAGDLLEAHRRAIEAMIEEATRQCETTIAEAEAFRAEARDDARREATQITEQAMSKAKATLAEAQEEAAVIIASRRGELVAIEAEARRRMEQLAAEEKELTDKVEIAARIYAGLQLTLKEVAEASINELAEAKTSLSKLLAKTATPRRRTDDPEPITDRVS
jgi:hypothetical protein